MPQEQTPRLVRLGSRYLRPLKTTYLDTGALQVDLFEASPTGRLASATPYKRLTVNGVGFTEEPYAFLDEPNLPEPLLKALEDQGVIAKTGVSGHSGDLSYPMVVFADDWLDGMGDAAMPEEYL